jgi:hypothetical protein
MRFVHNVRATARIVVLKFLHSRNLAKPRLAESCQASGVQFNLIDAQGNRFKKVGWDTRCLGKLLQVEQSPKAPYTGVGKTRFGKS